MIELAPDHLGDLAALLGERIGLHARPEALRALRVAVAARFDDREPPPVRPDGYVALLRSAAGGDELRRLLPHVTVAKTSFFRDQRQFDALAALLPELLARRRAAGRAVSIWSAGCATGEEAWSIAMTAAEAGAGPRDLELHATDVNPDAVAHAERGAFASRRLRGVPGALEERYFEREGDVRRVDARLRALLARAEPHNLVSRSYPRPAAGAWDAVFCRNVIIYFDKPTARAVLARFLSALAPGGWLFLGSSESLFALFDGFELVEVAGALVYRRPLAARAAARADAPEKAGAALEWRATSGEGAAARDAMSGHNRWTKIKHKKEAQGAAKGKLFTKLIKEITVSARMGGGDPTANARLRAAIDTAKDANMPSDNITRAIKKGTGELEGVSYEEAVYEGYGPGGVAMIVECLTDNRHRTAGDVRSSFAKGGGNLAAEGAVSWMFERRGVVEVKPGPSEDQVMEAAIEAGAEDVVSHGSDGFEVRTHPNDLHHVAAVLEKGFELGARRLTYVPKESVKITDHDKAKSMLKLVDLLEDLDDVQSVHANFEIDDRLMEAFEIAGP